MGKDSDNYGIIGIFVATFRIVYEVMEYKKIGETYYVRMDRGDEIISNLLYICTKESIPSAIFSTTIPMLCFLSRKTVCMEWQENILNRQRYSILPR